MKLGNYTGCLEKECVPKYEGELGFRDFEAFNQALLGRQAWRIVQEPDLLLAHILKGRYYHKSTFLEAVAGSRPSWWWRSILYGRDLVRQGLRWKVGSGCMINPFMDPWIPNTVNSRPVLNFSNPISYIPSTVADLFNCGRWDLEKINSIFDKHTVQQILSIPLSFEGVEDKLIWKLSTSGAYTVHSGYEVASGKFTTLQVFRPSSLYDECFWKKIWNLPVQPKLRIFLWKIFRGVLPIRDNLAKKFTIQSKCPVCLEEVESNEHLFMKYIMARKLARLINLQIDTFEHDCVAYSGRKLFKMDQRIQIRVVLMWWRLWKSRNIVLFQKAQLLPKILAKQFLAQLNEFEVWFSLNQDQKINQKVPRPLQISLRDSHLPFDFSIKVDGAISKEIGEAIGFMVLDSLGDIFFPGGKSFQGNLDPFTIESIALRESLKWCLQVRIREVLVEGDPESVNKRVLDNKSLHPIAGAIIQEIRILVTKFIRFKYNAIPRTKNQMAHNVAKFTLSFLPDSSPLINLTLFA
ncbi:Putative ribonuclease H protein At1g65750 [Linum perenne]